MVSYAGPSGEKDEVSSVIAFISAFLQYRVLRGGGENDDHNADRVSSRGGNWILFGVGRAVRRGGEVGDHDGDLTFSSPSSTDPGGCDIGSADMLSVVAG